jgi:hypothetical protein
MPTYPQMPLIMPTVGGSSGTWASLLQAAFLALDGHRHEGTGAGGAKIHPASMDIDANLSFAGWHITNLGAIQFSAVTALAAGTKCVFVNSADNELYWRTNTGTNVKITSGNGLNLVFAGGIGGDYAAVAAALNYDNGGARYTLKGAAGTNWARVAAGEVRIHEHGTSNSNFIALSVPAALAVQYTLTLPGALPGSTQLAQVSAAGVITYSNTIASAVTFSGGIAGTPNFTGAVTMASTLGVTGLVTASAGVTAAADQHVTVSGSGAFKHGDRYLHLHATAFHAAANNAPTTPTNTTSGGNAGQGWRGWAAAPNNTIVANVPLPAGARIKSIDYYLFKDGDATAMTMALRACTQPSSLASTIDTVSDASSGATAITNTRSSINYTITSTDQPFIVITATVSTQEFYGCRITYDHP